MFPECKAKINTVIGEAICFPHIENPTVEQID